LGEFNDRVNRLIKGLRSLCLPGDLVSIYAGNCRVYYEIIGRGRTRRHPLRAGQLAFHAEELAYVIDNSERRRRPVCGPDPRPQPYGHRLRISQGAQQDRSGAPRTRLFTFGDIGYLDEDGYLFMSDHKIPAAARLILGRNRAEDLNPAL